MQFHRLAAALATAVFTVTHASAATVAGGSDLFDAAKLTQVESWLTGDASLSYTGPLTFTNIFDKAAGDTATDFHTAVGNKGPTIVLMEATDSRNGVKQIIGGFNPQSWDASLGTYRLTPNAADRTAFIFNLTTNERRDQETNTFSGERQTFNRNDGVAFGGGHDIFVHQDLNTGWAFAWSYCADPLQDCHNINGDLNIMGLSYIGTTITYGAIEVFTISETTIVPLPATGLLLIAGLGGLAMVRRRGGPAQPR